jgi:hypothetical protein
MANSCGGADASVPDELEVPLKDYIRRTNPRAYFDATDQNDDMTYSCLLEDLRGTRCPRGKCLYNRNAAPTSNHTSKKRI